MAFWIAYLTQSSATCCGTGHPAAFQTCSCCLALSYCDYGGRWWCGRPELSYASSCCCPAAKPLHVAGPAMSNRSASSLSSVHQPGPGSHGHPGRHHLHLFHATCAIVETARPLFCLDPHLIPLTGSPTLLPRHHAAAFPSPSSSGVRRLDLHQRPQVRHAAITRAHHLTTNPRTVEQGDGWVSHLPPWLLYTQARATVSPRSHAYMPCSPQPLPWTG